MVLAPEHKLVELITTGEYRPLVEAYLEQTKKKTERERMTKLKLFQDGSPDRMPGIPFPEKSCRYG
jgi:hypothetical protein